MMLVSCSSASNRWYRKAHVGHGVKPENFDTVEKAILSTLETAFGEDWTPDLADAWTNAYKTLAGVMIAAGYPGPEPAQLASQVHLEILSWALNEPSESSMHPRLALNDDGTPCKRRAKECLAGPDLIKLAGKMRMASSVKASAERVEANSSTLGRNSC